MGLKYDKLAYPCRVLYRGEDITYKVRSVEILPPVENIGNIIRPSYRVPLNICIEVVCGKKIFTNSLDCEVLYFK